MTPLRELRRAGLRRCSRCEVVLQLAEYPIVRGRSGAESRGYWCRECRKEQRKSDRERKAQELGRDYLRREEYEERFAALRADRQAKRESERRAREADYAARRSPEALAATKRKATRRSVARQRERYNSDPHFRAQIQAKKIRRKRAQQGTQIEPVNRDIVAERDGWRCGICGGKVTRKNWSLDHVIPLSQGGPHTYANVVLAHRRCNSSRGPGRKPVQPSLFAWMRQ